MNRKCPVIRWSKVERLMAFNSLFYKIRAHIYDAEVNVLQVESLRLKIRDQEYITQRSKNDAKITNSLLNFWIFSCNFL